MARVKVSGKFSNAEQAVIVEIHMKLAYATDKTIRVGPIEGNIYLPVYCPELVQNTIISAMEGLGSVSTTIEPA